MTVFIYVNPDLIYDRHNFFCVSTHWNFLNTLELFEIYSHGYYAGKKIQIKPNHLGSFNQKNI